MENYRGSNNIQFSELPDYGPLSPLQEDDVPKVELI